MVKGKIKSKSPRPSLRAGRPPFSKGAKAKADKVVN
jgi:hypothetical protein